MTTNADEQNLRLKVIDAVCYRQGISGHLEQFERIEALVRQEVLRAYDDGYAAGRVSGSRGGDR